MNRSTIGRSVGWVTVADGLSKQFDPAQVTCNMQTEDGSVYNPAEVPIQGSREAMLAGRSTVKRNEK